MGTAISCTECSQVAGLIQKLVETPRKHRLFVQLYMTSQDARNRIHYYDITKFIWIGTCLPTPIWPTSPLGQKSGVSPILKVTFLRAGKAPLFGQLRVSKMGIGLGDIQARRSIGHPTRVHSTFTGIAAHTLILKCLVAIGHSAWHLPTWTQIGCQLYNGCLSYNCILGCDLILRCIKAYVRMWLGFLNVCNTI